MPSTRLPGESRPCTAVVLEIVDGRPWTARDISNTILRRHCRVLARTFRGPHPLTDPLRAPCRRLLEALCEKSGLLTDVRSADFPVVPVLTRIAAYFPRWRRSPETWSPATPAAPRETVRSLLQHLFAAWPVPACFDSAWLEKGELIYLERDWYCHLAAGGSLRNVSGMPPSVTSRALHLAMEAPPDLTIRQALRRGQVKSHGGSDALLEEVLASRMVRDLSNDAIWSRLFAKLATSPRFDARNFGIISDTLLAAISQDGPSRAEGLVNLPLAALIQHSRRFWEKILVTTREVRPGWKKSDIGCAVHRAELHRDRFTGWPRLTSADHSAFYNGNERLPCTIEELTHQWQLVAESRAMHHCVDTYGRKCRSGCSAIFSLRTASTSHLTIEVDRVSRRIVQVRGKRNCRYDAGRIPLLREWAEAVGFRI